MWYPLFRPVRLRIPGYNVIPIFSVKTKTGLYTVFLLTFLNEYSYLKFDQFHLGFWEQNLTPDVTRGRRKGWATQNIAVAHKR